MTAPAKAIAYSSPAGREDRDGLPQWLLTADHKRIGILTIGTALVLFLLNGALVLTMRAQLAQPNLDILSPPGWTRPATPGPAPVIKGSLITCLRSG